MPSHVRGLDVWARAARHGWPLALFLRPVARFTFVSGSLLPYALHDGLLFCGEMEGVSREYKRMTPFHRE